MSGIYSKFIDFIPHFESLSSHLTPSKYFPSDPFWWVDNLAQQNILKLLLNPLSWREGNFHFEDLLTNTMNNLENPQTIVRLQYDLANLSNKPIFAHIFKLGEGIFGKIVDYFDNQSYINLSLTSRFGYIVVQAYTHSKFIKLFRVYPSPNLSRLGRLLNVLQSIRDKSFPQIHDYYILCLSI